MKRLSTYREKAADSLSALMLFLAVVLAGGYGPLAAQAPAIPAPQSSPSDAGTGGQRSSPVISKQQLVVSESRDAGAAGWDDGKPKPVLAAQALELSPHFIRATGTIFAAAAIIGPAASPFDARGPPAQS